MSIIGLLMAIFVIIAVVIVANYLKNNIFIFLNTFNKKWILCIYCLAIISSTIALYLISDKTILQTESTKSFGYDNDNITKVAKEQKLDKTKGISKSKELNFDYTGDYIKLILPDAESIRDKMIMVDRKDTDDGKIKVAYYKTEIAITLDDGYQNQHKIDVTKMVKTPDIKLSGDQLTITKSKDDEFNIIEFKKAFTAQQFYGVKFGGGQSSMITNGQYYHLLIPKNLKVIHKDLDVWLVGEERYEEG